ncbi:nitroreductase family protein [Veronia pacifica]|nr:nitroreductase family protein [Veronia pacifica]
MKDYRVYQNASLIKKHEDVEGVHSLGLIIRLYHTIEKGLSVKERRYEFSMDHIELLQKKMMTYCGDKNEPHFLSAFKTLGIYFSIHEKIECSKRFNAQARIFENLKKKYGKTEIGGGTKSVKKVEYPNRIETIEILKKRHSIRDYDGEFLIDKQDIIRVIDLAKLCPSACNRHAIKIFYSLDKHKNSEILKYQNGSRTFRDNVPGLLIVASDLRYQEGVEERNLGYIEGGIWLMSLVNSLYLNGFGSCVLNWCVSPSHDQDFKTAFGIPEYYQISALISFGKQTEDQKVPYSIRCKSEDFIEKVEL